ncbi:MAG: LysM peptidoglycan-binding domain-containing protein [Caldilineaceae bacterium]|nr:LysM peptidoglycan-binding domain-containing protein [Caldilineaceae bacterium]
MKNGFFMWARAVAGALLLTMLLGSLAAAQDAAVHVVEPGETLSEIAKANGTTTAALMQINQISSADLVLAGRILYLPAADAEGATDADSGTDSVADAHAETASPLNVPAPRRFVDADGAFRYFVEPGDSLASIAAEFRVGVSVLVDLNRLSPARRLTPGESLFVPYSPFGGGQERIHVVEPGDSLAALAQAYATTTEAIIARNGIGDPGMITAGTQLWMPPPAPVERMAVFPVDEEGVQRPLVAPTSTEKWIDVDLSEQKVVAYQGNQPVKTFTVSTGRDYSPTVKGTFRIWIKTAEQDMWGGDRAAGDYYYLPGVKWVQYFYQDYSFHTAYWHNDFGTPASRGCVNMREQDAKWLFEWAGPAWDDAGDGWQRPTDKEPGTLVVVHD